MRRILPLVFLIASPGFGYIRQTLPGSSPSIPLTRVDNTAIQFFLNNQIVPGYQSSASGSAVTVITSDSNPQQAVRNALASWNGVSTANIHFLPLQLTGAVINSSDYQATIAFGSTPSDLSAVGGALALTVTSYAPSAANQSPNGLVSCTANCTYPAGGITDSDIILNPAVTFSTTGAKGSSDLQAVLLHEFGHSLSANHSGILGASMFQFPTNRFLTTDDLAFVTSSYPLPGGAAPLGTISGTVTAKGGAPVPYALLTAFNASAGVTVGGVTNPDGTYSFAVPPGTYQMYAEPLNGVMPINIYLTAPQESIATATQFQTTLYNGSLNVTANNTVTANITVTPGTSSLKEPVVAVTPVNGAVTSGIGAGPVTVPSGGSVDLVLSGAGFDGTLGISNFSFYGQGITLQPGSVRVDKSQGFNGNPLLRVTLKVDATATPSLASFVVTSGSSTLSFSGALVIVPPTPTFASAGVLSSASNLGSPGGGAVSPGDYVVLYGNGLGPIGGPVYGGFNNQGFDSYGFLPTSLAGVSVTFDGVAAPLFFVTAGQINLQVPFEVAGKTSTQVVVNYLGSPSAAVSVPVLTSHPAFFTFPEPTNAYIGNPSPDSSGNYTNTAASPASRGDYITVYGAGIGVLPSAGYPLQTGLPAPAPPPGSSANGYTCMIGGINTLVAYAGWTPTTVALAQWTVQIPTALTTTGALPIICKNNTGSTQPNLTVFVK